MVNKGSRIWIYAVQWNGTIPDDPDVSNSAANVSTMDLQGRHNSPTSMNSSRV